MHANQIIEDVPLMDMDGDQCFILHPLEFGQVLSSDLNQGIQDVQEEGIGLHHDPLVNSSMI